MAKNGIKSPDIIDAMSFAFLEDANSYIVADNSGNGGTFSAIAVAQEKADELFSDV